MICLEYLAVTEVHVNATRETWIETSDCAHDVDPLELIRTVFLEDWGVLHRVLVWTRCSIDVARVGIPRSGWVRMVIGDLAVANHNMM